MMALITIILTLGICLALINWKRKKLLDKTEVEVCFKYKMVVGWYDGEIVFSHGFSIVDATPEKLKALIANTQKELDEYVERVNKLKASI